MDGVALQELQESLITDTDSHACCLKCLMSAIMKKETAAAEEMAAAEVSLLAPQWKSDLLKNKVKTAMGCVNLNVAQPFLNAIHILPPFIMQAKTKT